MVEKFRTYISQKIRKILNKIRKILLGKIIVQENTQNLEKYSKFGEKKILKKFIKILVCEQTKQIQRQSSSVETLSLSLESVSTEVNSQPLLCWIPR